MNTERSGLDRRNRWRLSWRWSERRSGFDRRDHRTVTTFLRNLSRDKFRFGYLLVLTNALNFFDVVMTRQALAAGSIEGNPIMAYGFSVNPLLTNILKLMVVLIATACFWQGRKYKMFIKAAIMACSVFLALAVWHIYGATFVY